MRSRWSASIHMTWPPLAMVVGLLCLLTYLLLQSRTPKLLHNTPFHTAVQDIALHDVRLTRDVLLVRAGLLPHADALVQTSRALRQALAALQPGETQSVSTGDMAVGLGQLVEPLTVALEQKLRFVEDFTADNALLQNSFLYVLHAGQEILTQTTADGQTILGAEVGRLSHVLLRLLHSPQSPAGAELQGLLDQLPRVPMFQQDLDLLAMHGRRIVALLPQVDTLLHHLLSVPTTRHLQELQTAVLQYDARRAARAEVFRLLLYLVAIALLGSLLLLFSRLQAQAQALRSSEEHFRALTETASEAIISTDQTWTIVSWNAAATLMFGYDAAEALGTSLLRLLPTGAQAALRSWLTQESAPGPLRPPVELLGVRKDGSTFPLDLSLSAWSTAHGTYMTGMIRDLTARKQLEEQTRQQEMQLIQANKMTALGTLVAGVAHEVNNPNHLVLLNTQMLADTWDDALPILDAHAQKSGDFLLGGLPYHEMRDTLPLLIQDLHAGAQHIECIIDDLRDFARPGVRRRQEPVCLNAAVQHGLRLMRHLIQRKTTQFKVDLADSLPSVWSDAQDLVHVVVNLLVNALEALPDPGCGVRVSTYCVPEESRVILEVADQGVGIAPQHLARLCDPFFTTKAATGGTGLGLAITATLVYAHGGRLTFESTPGQGTRACVSLVLADSLRAATAASSTEAR